MVRQQFNQKYFCRSDSTGNSFFPARNGRRTVSNRTSPGSKIKNHQFRGYDKLEMSRDDNFAPSQYRNQQRTIASIPPLMSISLSSFPSSFPPSIFPSIPPQNSVRPIGPNVKDNQFIYSSMGTKVSVRGFHRMDYNVDTNNIHVNVSSQGLELPRKRKRPRRRKQKQNIGKEYDGRSVQQLRGSEQAISSLNVNISSQQHNPPRKREPRKKRGKRRKQMDEGHGDNSAQQSFKPLVNEPINGVPPKIVCHQIQQSFPGD